jgi:hypothetical protein
MNFDPRVFGEGFHLFIQKENGLLGNSLGVIFIILYLVLRYENKYKKLFAIYFTFNWIFLFVYWGIYAVFYWFKVGIPYLAVYSLTPGKE